MPLAVALPKNTIPLQNQTRHVLYFEARPLAIPRCVGGHK